MDSPWNEDPGSNNTHQEAEWSKISSEFTNAGYREGITAGKESALQEGFDSGFAASGAPIGRQLGLLRGIASALVVALVDQKTPPPPPLLDGNEQMVVIINETRDIVSRLSKIRFSDIMPPDLEAEEHARQHLEDGEEEGLEISEKRTMESLEDMFNKMGTGTEKANRHHPAGVADGRLTLDDLNGLRSRLTELASLLGLRIDCT